MGAILGVWNDYVGPCELEYEAWYEQEHIPQRLGFAGFRQARRYQAVTADRRFFTWYDLDDMAVLRAPAYLACLDDPTPRTRAAMPGFRGMVRAELVVTASAGQGLGGFAVCLRRDAGAVDATGLDAWLDRPGVVRVQAWATPPGPPPAMSTEFRFRGAPDGMAASALLVECRRSAEASRVADLLAPAAVADPACHLGIYQLLSCTDAAGAYFTSGQPPSDIGR